MRLMLLACPPHAFRLQLLLLALICLRKVFVREQRVLSPSPRTVNRHQKTILGCLRDGDVSIRRRALDLLFIMCTPATAAAIVDELLSYLSLADYSMREELVLKTAVLAERWAAGRCVACQPA